MDLVDADAVAAFAGSLQRDDGSFAGDEWGEIDTRFSYCALCLCKLCGRMDAIDVDAAAAFVDRCKNWDGGYGAEPGGESHAGQIFVCVAALEIAGGDAPGTIDREALGWWLCERQVKAGGLNGRPEKLPDVCYGWWVLSALSILNKLEWIDADALARFILDAQDGEKGGIADRPSDEPDVFHTFFGVAGLSLLGFEGLRRIDPTYALPADVVQRMGLRET
jgi:geranylgeranyl transferase type-2 subunit beta